MECSQNAKTTVSTKSGLDLDSSVARTTSFGQILVNLLLALPIRHLKFFLLPYLALTLVCRWMAWLGIYFNYVDTQEHVIIMPGCVFILPPYTREKKPFGQCWDRTRLTSSASQHAIHYAIASRARHLICLTAKPKSFLYPASAFPHPTLPIKTSR